MNDSNKIENMKFGILKYIILLLFVILLFSCTKEDTVSSFFQLTDEIPSNALIIQDPQGDLTLVAGGPAAVIPYSPADIISVILWKAEGYFFIKVSFAGELPTSAPSVYGQEVHSRDLMSLLILTTIFLPGQVLEV